MTKIERLQERILSVTLNINPAVSPSIEAIEGLQAAGYANNEIGRIFKDIALIDNGEIGYSDSKYIKNAQQLNDLYQGIA